MKHCYIFDYCSGEIYHCEVPETCESECSTGVYIEEHYGYRLHSDTHYMIVNNPLNIKEL